MSQSVEVLKEMQVQPTGAEPTETVKLILVVANKSSSYFEGFTAVDTNNAKLDDVVTQIENELRELFSQQNNTKMFLKQQNKKTKTYFSTTSNNTSTTNKSYNNNNPKKDTRNTNNDK